MASARAASVVDDSDLQSSFAMQTDTSTHALPVVAEFTAEEIELFLMATATTSVLHAVPASSSSSTSSIKSEPEDEPLSAAAKRIRRTEIERLSRRRRQTSLRAMRDEVKALEAKFATLLSGHAIARARADDWQRHLMHEMDDALVSASVKDRDTKFADTLRQLRDKFIDLKLLERDLEAEQKKLNRMLRGRELLSMSIQSIAFTFLRDWAPVEAVASNLTVVEMVDFVPATPEQYATYLRDAYAELMALEASAQFTSSGNSCMGWSDRQFVDSEKVVHSMTKSFEKREPRALLDESWALFADEARLRQSFGAWGTTMALRVLDRPSEDLMVLYRTNTRRQCQHKRFHIVYLLFRVRTDTGFTLCMRYVPALEMPLKGPGKWTGIFTWLHFRETGDGCEVEYNNFIPALKLKRVPHPLMLIEFITTVVNWESSCVTPRLLVGSS